MAVNVEVKRLATLIVPADTVDKKEFRAKTFCELIEEKYPIKPTKETVDRFRTFNVEASMKSTSSKFVETEDKKAIGARMTDVDKDEIVPRLAVRKLVEKVEKTAMLAKKRFVDNLLVVKEEINPLLA